MLNMRSAAPPDDLTARARIRDAALRLYAQRGFDAVTLREVARAADVSAALVVHHFGSLSGLREAVDRHAVALLQAVFSDVEDVSWDEPRAAVEFASALERSLPPGSPLPAYLARLLTSDTESASAVFHALYALTVDALSAQQGVLTPTDDPAVRAAFLLCNDLAVLLLRPRLREVLGLDPLAGEGLRRWSDVLMTTYTEGILRKEPS
jgi:AcrR family transcriptional regulator